MNKKIFLRNKPFDPNDAKEMQDWIESSLQNLSKSIYLNGVVSGLAVTVSSGMTLSISPGLAYDSNYKLLNIDTAKTVSLSNGDSSPRYDLIVIRYKSTTTNNADTNNIYGQGTSYIYSQNQTESYEIVVYKGVPATTPVKPNIPSGEVALAYVYIAANATSVTSTNIEDIRSFVDLYTDFTVDPTMAPTNSNTGKIKQLISWVVNRIKAITGESDWKTSPAVDLKTTKSHIDATTNVHGATSSATANKIIIRDSSGRAKVAAPSASDDIARKDTVDAVQTNLNNHVGDTNNPHGVTKTQIGLGNVDNIQQASKTEFNTHLNDKNNPHSVTASQVGAYTKTETDNITQGKADAAQTAAINFAKSFGLGDVAKDISNTDVNNLDVTGFYKGTALTNAPETDTSIVWNIINIKVSSTGAIQLAIKVTGNGEVYTRRKSAGVLGNWTQLETTSGAQSKADTIQANLNSHTGNKNNPHSVTAAQVGAYTKSEADSMAQSKADSALSSSLEFVRENAIVGDTTPLPNNTDFNTVVTPGVYRIPLLYNSGGSNIIGTYVNSPRNPLSGLLIVGISDMDSSDGKPSLFQMVISTDSRFYFRPHYFLDGSSGWGSWRETLTTAGGTMSGALDMTAFGLKFNLTLAANTLPASIPAGFTCSIMNDGPAGKGLVLSYSTGDPSVGVWQLYFCQGTATPSLVFYRGSNIIENSEGIYTWTSWRRLLTFEENNSVTWFDLDLMNGVQAYDSSTPPQYTKVGNIVFIRGAVRNILSSNTVIANLPQGYRPSISMHAALPSSIDGNNAASFARWLYNTNGDIKLENLSTNGKYGSAYWYPFDTSFLVEPL